MKYTSKLIYNNSKDIDESLWVLYEDNNEFPFLDGELGEPYTYEKFDHDVIVCEYEYEFDDTDL